MKIAFYIEYPYYFPHFIPIAEAFEKKGHDVQYILSSTQNTELMLEIAKENEINYTFDEALLFSKEVDYLFFANFLEEIEKVKAKTIFMDHGVGTKHCDYERALKQYDIVLVEGEYRYNTLNTDFPSYSAKVKKVGFSKLDMVINFSGAHRAHYIKKYNIDTNNPTILYAPTFFPSSIEKMSDTFPSDFSECNVIVKPHYLSLHRGRYKNQRKKFEKWKKYENCKVCDVSEYSLVPFLALCDVMISDESSAIFEFTALDKPVVLNRFLKLRWSYYLNPRKLLNRMDAGIDTYRSIGDNAQSYEEMLLMTKENLKNKDKYKNKRAIFTKDLCGDVDGKSSQRIVQVIEDDYAK